MSETAAELEMKVSYLGDQIKRVDKQLLDAVTKIAEMIQTHRLEVKQSKNRGVVVVVSDLRDALLTGNLCQYCEKIAKVQLDEIEKKELG